MGGEKCASGMSAEMKTGSPPHGRGKANERNVKLNLTRITPAWAGKRPAPRCTGHSKGDHPRMGGEKLRRWYAKNHPLGSPPRGRGKVLSAPYIAQSAGITPAWAGKRTRVSTRTTLPRDHPRVGGEKRPFSTYKKAPRGSPPRRRGKVVQSPYLSWLLGITPAWAGKSDSPPVCGWVWEDHPRVGGEKPGISAMVSSPVDDGHQAKAIGLAPANALAQQGLEGLRVRHLQNTLVGHSQ